MITQVNLLSNLVAETASIDNRLASVQEQIASGLVSTTYSGLGVNVLRAVSIAPQVSEQAAYQTNISAAQGRLQVTQSALSQISTITANFYAQVNTFNASNPQSVQNLALGAKEALQQVASQLNTKDGNVFVFAGTDTANAPVTTTDPATLASQLLASPPTQAPFSTTIGTSAPKIQIGDSQWQQVGVLANANTYVTSQPPTTGSYMRDILTSLASLSQLTTDPNPASTVSTVRNQLNGAISALGAETGVLGGIQNELVQQNSNLAAVQTTLKSQLSDAEDVDVAAAITQSTQLQTQLQASYQVIASTKGLSLASYL